MRPALLIVLLAVAGCSTQQGSPEVYSDSTLNVADVALANGAPAMALQVAQQVLAKDPKNADAWVRKGSAELALGQTGQAAATFRQALSLAPDSVPAAMGYGRTQLQTDPDAAADTFAKIVLRDPTNATAAADLGVARDLSGHHAEAQQAYREALALAPTEIGTQVDLGLSLALSGKPQEALAILRPLGERPDASRRVRQDLAVALTLAGDVPSATAMLQHDMPRQQAERTVVGYQALQAP